MKRIDASIKDRDCDPFTRQPLLVQSVDTSHGMRVHQWHDLVGFEIMLCVVVSFLELLFLTIVLLKDRSIRCGTPQIGRITGKLLRGLELVDSVWPDVRDARNRLEDGLEAIAGCYTCTGPNDTKRSTVEDTVA